LPTPSSAQITRLLKDWGQGDLEARDALIPLMYEELRRIARRHLWHERPDHTLQSAALVNEVYLRLARRESPPWQSRAHFFGVAAQMMRHILVDHARSRGAAKRGAGGPRLSLIPEIALPQKPDLDVVELDAALNKLASLDPQASRLVELRFFAGLSIEETSVVMGKSPRTVKRDWSAARAWLRLEMRRGSLK
jgi:RNA polymerase sigma factor (TIGR02999 family)